MNNIGEGINKIWKGLKNNLKLIIASVASVLLVVLSFYLVSYYKNLEEDKRMLNISKELEKRLAQEKENKLKNELKSDKYYWNGGYGRYFKSSDGCSLHLTIKKKFSRTITIWKKKYFQYSETEKTVYGSIYDARYDLIYKFNNDGSYDITRIDASGNEIIDSQYFNTQE